MTSKSHMKALVIASALFLVGGGCLSGPIYKDAEKVENGNTVSEQADIIVDDLLEGVDEEDQALLEEGGDASLFDADAEELNNYDQVYDESEF